MSREIVVADSNSLNTYGEEVARVLSKIAPVVHVVAADSTLTAPIAAGRSVVLQRVLAPTKAGVDSRKFVRLAMRVRDPFAIIARARGRALVLVWVRDPWWALVLGLLAPLMCEQTVVVHHNPASMRPNRPGRIAATLERFLLRRVEVAVHTEFLREVVEREGLDGAAVVGHPAYAAVAERFEGRNPEPGNFVFVGRVREDKGLADIQAIGACLPSGSTLIVAGRSTGVPDSLGLALARVGVRLELPGEGRDLSEAELLTWLARAQAVVAPYTNATESGTLILCLTLGVPVIARRSRATERLVVPGFLYGDLDEFSRVARISASVSHGATFRLTPAEQDALCLEGWKGTLS